MFNYVEEMRKYGLFTMSKTYGVRIKDSEQNIIGMDDTYPLQNLVNILCYESLDEARDACQHYGLTVKDSSSDNGPVVLWKASRFREPRDPKKGVHIPLKPHKMIKTIESKLLSSGNNNKRVTRLAICRGQVSGVGATITSTTPVAEMPAAAVGAGSPSSEETEVRRQKLQEDMKRLQKQQEETKQRMAALVRAREVAAQKQRQQLLQQAEEAERHRRAIEEEAAARQAEQQQLLRQQEQKRQDEEAAAAAAAAAEIEESRRRRRAVEEESKRQRIIKEEQQRRQRMLEEEERKRQHEEELKRQEEARERQLEIERQQRLQKEAEIRAKRIAEEKRIQAIKDAANKRRQVVDNKWHDAILMARKKLLIKLWKRATLKSSLGGIHGTQTALMQLDPTYTTTSKLYHLQQTGVIPQLWSEERHKNNNTEMKHFDSSFFRRLAVTKSSLNKNIDDCWKNSTATANSCISRVFCGTSAILCTVAIVFSTTGKRLHDDKVSNDVKTWINSRLGGDVDNDGFNRVHHISNNVRISFVVYGEDDLGSCQNNGASALSYYYDAVIYVALPCDDDSTLSFPTLPYVDYQKAAAVLELITTIDQPPSPRSSTNNILTVVARAYESYQTELDIALDTCIHYVTNKCIQTTIPKMDEKQKSNDGLLNKRIMVNRINGDPQNTPFLSVYPISITSFIRKIVHNVIWNIEFDEDHHYKDDRVAAVAESNSSTRRTTNTISTNLVDAVKQCFLITIEIFENIRQNLSTDDNPYSTWPHPVFEENAGTSSSSSHGSVVPFYFSNNESMDGTSFTMTQQQQHLPLKWSSYLGMDHLSHALSLLFTPRLFVVPDGNESNANFENTLSSSSLQRLIETVFIDSDFREGNKNEGGSVMKEVDFYYNECIDLLHNKNYRTCVERCLDHIIELSQKKLSQHPDQYQEIDTIYLPNHLTENEISDEISLQILKELECNIEYRGDGACFSNEEQLRRRMKIEWNEFHHDYQQTYYDEQRSTPLLVGSEEHSVKIDDISTKQKQEELEDVYDNEKSSKEEADATPYFNTKRTNDDSLFMPSSRSTETSRSQISSRSSNENTKRRRILKEQQFEDSLRVATRRKNNHVVLKVAEHASFQDDGNKDESKKMSFSLEYKKSKTFTAHLEALLNEGGNNLLY